MVSISIWTSSERGVIQWNCLWVYTFFIGGGEADKHTSDQGLSFSAITKTRQNRMNKPFFKSDNGIWYKREQYTEIQRFNAEKTETYFKMWLNDRSSTTRPGAWPPYLLCRDCENRWDRFRAARHRPIGLFARKLTGRMDRSVLKTENDNAGVIYKMRWAYAAWVHSRDDRIENVNQGCPSPLLLLQLQLVWKLSTGVTSLG